MTTLAIASRFFRSPTPFDAATTAVRSWGFDALALDVPGPVPPGAREESRGIRFPAVLYRGDARVGVGDDFIAALDEAFRAAKTTRAETLVVEGAGDMPAERGAREAAVEHAARTLHGPLKAGVPLLVRHGARPGDLLGADETEWLLGALGGLSLMIDPARAHALHAAEAGPEPEAWAERFGRRVRLVACHGWGGRGTGGLHPAEGGLDWRALRSLLPEAAPWILDLDPDLGSDGLVDAARYLEDALGR